MFKLFYSPDLPTANRLWKNATPNTITKVFIVFIIAPWWMFRACVPCWTKSCRF